MASRLANLMPSAALALAIALPLPAAAQPTTSRVVVAVNGGAQAAPSGLSDHFEFERNVETATVDAKYPMKPSPLFDGGVSVRVWKNLGIGVAASHGTHNGSVKIDARIPHLFQFNQPRTVTGEQKDITRAETGVHLQLQYSIPASARVVLVLSAGPSWLSVEQDLVNDVKYAETYPYDEATFQTTETDRAKASVVGYNASADLRWMFGPHIGLGGLVRITRGTVDLETNQRRIAVHPGGVQGGAGIRLVF